MRISKFERKKHEYQKGIFHSDLVLRVSNFTNALEGTERCISKFLMKARRCT